MFRSFFVYLSKAGWARGFITRFPLARAAAGRFVAGERAEDAIAAIRALNARGINATLDHLGESVSNRQEAERAAADYVHVLDRIAESGVRSNVSIKLTQFGLDVDQEACLANVRRVLDKARATGNYVRIDMEGTPHTDRTLDVFRHLADEYDNLGLVVQSYLYRTEQDVQALLAMNPPTRLRLCKGAYKEPADKAFPHKADVDRSFVKIAQFMLDRAASVSPIGADGRRPPLAALATHDEKIIQAARSYADEKRIPRGCFEFQMLHGIRRDLQVQLAAQGYNVRVYVPYGTEWYPYFMRRLGERPANVWFIVSNFFRR